MSRITPCTTWPGPPTTLTSPVKHRQAYYSTGAQNWTRADVSLPLDPDDLGCYFERATALHDAIYEGSHNAFLLDMARNITVCLCAYRKHLSNALHLPIVTSFEENKNVVDAIVRGDSAEAEKWMRQHTELRREELADLITAISAPTRRAA